MGNDKRIAALTIWVTHLWLHWLKARMDGETRQRQSGSNHHSKVCMQFIFLFFSTSWPTQCSEKSHLSPPPRESRRSNRLADAFIVYAALSVNYSTWSSYGVARSNFYFSACVCVCVWFFSNFETDIIIKLTNGFNELYFVHLTMHTRDDINDLYMNKMCAYLGCVDISHNKRLWQMVGQKWVWLCGDANSRSFA